MDIAEKPARRPRRKPETETAKRRRLDALAVQLADREHRAATALAHLTGGRRRERAHVRPLSKITDETHRLQVWRARVERLEALLDGTERKRETRAKIVLGATVLAEARRDPDDPLLARLVEILDQRIDRPRDRQAIAEMLGLAIAPVKSRSEPALPDFDALAQAKLRETRRAEAARADEPAPKVRERKKGG